MPDGPGRRRPQHTTRILMKTGLGVLLVLLRRETGSTIRNVEGTICIEKGFSQS